MSDIYVTETDTAQLAANSHAVKMAVDRQRRRETVQSAVTALLGFGVLIAILALIALIPTTKNIPQIVTYQAASPEEEPPIRMKELTNNAQPKPPGASSSMAKVIASQSQSPVAVPIPVTANPDSLFGMEEDFGPGFGLEKVMAMAVAVPPFLVAGEREGMWFSSSISQARWRRMPKVVAELEFRH
jgi:hypothetical protein